MAWRAKWTKSLRVSAKVVCIGNLTAGGTGKTPVAIAIGEVLRTRGLKVAFLSRGFGGRERGPLLVDTARHGAADVGDEPLLLAGVAPTIVSRDRRAGAKLAVAQGADVIVMDDGHQNFDLVKDLSIVVIDSENPCGNGHVLPAGPLRESVAQGMTRADAVVLVGTGRKWSKREIVPTLRARMKSEPSRDLGGRRLLAFAGIGQPVRFFESVEAQGALLVDTKAFADHHAYRADEISKLKSAARANNADLITTEKDYVRLAPADREDVESLPVVAVFEDNESLALLLEKFELGTRPET